MRKARTRVLAATLSAGMCLVGCGGGGTEQVAVQQSAATTQDVPVPEYRVDPSWPKMPLRNKWLIQGVPVMVTDHNDHIWVVSRPRDIAADESGATTTPPRTMAGQLHWIDAIAMDSLGNIYTGEVDDGKRVQKFVLVNGDGVRRPRPHD